MRTGRVFFWLSLPMAAAITNTQVLGTTATQALISYTAPDTAACSVEISKSPTYTPLVHDVDPMRFAGSNLDSRAGSIMGGRHRLFVAGRRAAPAADTGPHAGRRFSRALESNTTYSFRITCGADVATGSFRTMNPPLGKTYTDPLPTDEPGQYAYPSVIDWMDPNESWVDPQTGVLLKRILLPQKFGVSNYTSTQDVNNAGFGESVFALDAGWQNGQNARGISADGALASYTGSGLGTPGYLYFRIDNVSDLSTSWNTIDEGLDYFQVVLQGTCTGNAGSEDCKILVCLTVDGVSCATRAAEVGLSNTSSVYTVGDTTPGMAFWNKGPEVPVARVGAATPVGKVNVTADEATGKLWVDYSSGNRFPFWLTQGSRIRIGNLTSNSTAWADCIIEGIEAHNGRRLILPTGGCLAQAGITPPLTGVEFAAPNFGWMIAKKTNSPDTVSIDYAGWMRGKSTLLRTPDTGSIDVCAPTKTGGGYFCWFRSQGNIAFLFWIQPESGEVRHIGQVSAPAKPAEWDTIHSLGSVKFDANDPRRFYFSGADTAGRKVVLMGFYKDPNYTALTPGSTALSFGSACADTSQPNKLLGCAHNGVPNAVDWINLTPGDVKQCGASGNQPCDLQTQVAALSANSTVPYNTAQHGGCSVQFAQYGYLFGHCYPGQDLAGYLFWFDPGDRDPARAGLAGGPRVIAAASTTSSAYPLRWCVIHGTKNMGPDSGWGQLSCNQAIGWSGAAAVKNGGGPWVVQIAGVPGQAGTLPAAADCGPEDCVNPPPDSITTVTIQASQPAGCPQASTDPFDPSPGPNESGCPGAFGPFLPGDLLCLQANTNTSCDMANDELVRLHRKVDATTWEIVRGLGNSTPKAMAGTMYAWGYGGGRNLKDFNMTTGGPVFWHYSDATGTNPRYNMAADPDATSLALDLTARKDAENRGAHQTYNSRSQSFVEIFNGGQCSQQGLSASGSCYAVRRGGMPGYFADPIKVAGGSAKFHNVRGMGIANEHQSHVSKGPYVQEAPAGEARYVLDANPFVGTGASKSDTSETGTWYWVDGSLWKTSCTVADATRPDDLSGPCTVNRKAQATLAVGGRFALIDVSGPGSLITGGATDRHKYCVVRVAGECYSGSQAGQVYANVPWVTTTGQWTKAGSTWSFTYGPYQQAICDLQSAALYQGGSEYSKPCIGNASMYSQSAGSQIGTTRTNPNAELGRMLTTGLSRYLIGDIFWNSHPIPDGSWTLFSTPAFANYGTVPMMAKTPPYGPEDSINRGDFIPLAISLTTPPPGTSNAVVEFGYAENGDPNSFYCTSRREKCLAVATDIPNDGFKFPSDGAGGVESGVTGTECANGCSIRVPVIPQRVVYYQVKYRDTANVVIAKSGLQAAAVP